MRKISKAVLAAGMAAATIASGLSFGAASASAAPEDEIVKSAPFEFVTQLDDNTWRGMNAEGRLGTFPTKSEAEAFAAEWVALPKMDGYFTINLASDLNTCMNAGRYSTDPSQPVAPWIAVVRKASQKECVTSPADFRLWSQGDVGQLLSKSTGNQPPSTWWISSELVTWGGYGPWAKLKSSDPATQNPWTSVPLDLAKPLSARAENIDAAKRTATLNGSAKPGQTIVVNGDENGAVDADENGKWTYDLTGLKLGKNAVTVEAFDGAQSVGKITVDVELPVGELTAGVEFPANLSDRAVLAGTADKNATINVLHDGNVVGTGMANKTTGDWDIELDAPNAAGNYVVEVQQLIGGETAGTKTVAVGYGAGVDIDTQDGVEVADGQSLRITGTGEKGAGLKVYEAGKPSTILKPGTVSATNGSFGVAVGPLEAREYKLVVEQTGKGNNHTTDTITVNPGHNDVAAPTGSVAFDADVTKKATASGTGVDGGTINLFDDATDKQIGSAQVVGGKWSTPIDAVGAGKHTIRIEQSGIEGMQTATTEADFGAGVAITGPTGSVTGGLVTVNGTGQTGTDVTVQAGGKTETVPVTGGTWSTQIEIPASNTAVEITATQHSKGALTTTSTQQVTPNGAIAAQDVAITGPAKHTYKPNTETTVSGTATPYADIELRFQWSNTVYGTAKADANGAWSITRQFGPSAKYELTATQKRFDGTSSTSAAFALNPEGITNQDVVITEPSNHTFTPDVDTTIRGTATPYADIELRFQWNNSVYGKARANADGNWNIVRKYGNVSYDLTATQRRGDGTSSVSDAFTINPERAFRKLTLGSPSQQSTFTPDVDVLFTGTGTPGATITATAPAWNNNEIFTTTVDANGNWKIKRSFKDLTYVLDITQEAKDGTTDVITGVTLTPAKQ